MEKSQKRQNINSFRFYVSTSGKIFNLYSGAILNNFVNISVNLAAKFKHINQTYKMVLNFSEGRKFYTEVCLGRILRRLEVGLASHPIPGFNFQVKIHLVKNASLFPNKVSTHNKTVNHNFTM